MGQAFTLLNPGPINVSDAVRAALADSEDQCHREPEYLEMQGRVRAKLLQAFGNLLGIARTLLFGQILSQAQIDVRIAQSEG